VRLQDCYDKGLLRKRRPDPLKSERALELAKADLKRAARLLESEFYMESRLLSYTGMFQAARAILFKDGVFERSHACVVEYLRVNYTKKHILDINYVNWLDSLRVERHETLYGLDIIDVTKDEAEDALSKGLKFVEKIDGILGKKE
jgi:uncharacterized protein (UPF0332 family)